MLEPMKIIFTYTTMLPGCQEKDFGILWGFWIFCKKIWLKSASPQKLQQTVHLTRNLGINTVTPLLKRSQMASWSKNCKITLFWWRYTKKFIWHTGIVKTKRLKNYYFIDDSTRDHSVDIIALCLSLSWKLKLSYTAQMTYLLNLRYCAIILLHVLHLYSPFSMRITSSPSSSFGFS